MQNKPMASYAELKKDFIKAVAAHELYFWMTSEDQFDDDQKLILEVNYRLARLAFSGRESQPGFTQWLEADVRANVRSYVAQSV